MLALNFIASVFLPLFYARSCATLMAVLVMRRLNTNSFLTRCGGVHSAVTAFQCFFTFCFRDQAMDDLDALTAWILSDATEDILP